MPTDKKTNPFLIGQVNIEKAIIPAECAEDVEFFKVWDKIPLILTPHFHFETDYSLIWAVDFMNSAFIDGMFITCEENGMYLDKAEMIDHIRREAFETDGCMVIPKYLVEVLATAESDAFEEYMKQHGESVSKIRAEVIEQYRDILGDNGISTMAELAKVLKKDRYCREATVNRNGTCEGYCKSRDDDEPAEMCKECLRFENYVRESDDYSVMDADGLERYLIERQKDGRQVKFTNIAGQTFITDGYIAVRHDKVPKITTDLETENILGLNDGDFCKLSPFNAVETIGYQKNILISFSGNKETTYADNKFMRYFNLQGDIRSQGNALGPLQIFEHNTLVAIVMPYRCRLDTQTIFDLSAVKYFSPKQVIKAV